MKKKPSEITTEILQLFVQKRQKVAINCQYFFKLSFLQKYFNYSHMIMGKINLFLSLFDVKYLQDFKNGQKTEPLKFLLF